MQHHRFFRNQPFINLFSSTLYWQISPWEMIRLLEILGLMWDPVHLHDAESGGTSIIKFLPQISHSNLSSESDKLGKNSSNKQRKRTYLLKAMNTKNTSHKFTFSLYKFEGQIIFFCYNENKSKETFKSMHSPHFWTVNQLLIKSH